MQWYRQRDKNYNSVMRIMSPFRVREKSKPLGLSEIEKEVDQRGWDRKLETVSRRQMVSASWESRALQAGC